jgi:hypothetical protein
MSKIIVLEQPHRCAPMNGTPGLYMQILSAEGVLKKAQIHEFCAPYAKAHGYNPDGKGLVGMPCAHGIKSYSYAVWFYDRLN